TYSNKYLTISGFITKPQENSITGNKQYIFLNGRSISDKAMSRTIKDAYGTLLATNKHPVFVLSLTLPYEYVDVNVHPRKEQVRFVDTQMLYDDVHTAIAQTLTENNLTFYED